MPPKRISRFVQSGRGRRLEKRKYLAAIACFCFGLAVEGALGDQAASQPQKGAATPAAPPLQTASTHPMKYYISLPKDWSANRKWPVLVAPSAHYGDKGKAIAMFTAQRDARKANFIIVQPLVINSDRLTPMQEYRGPILDAIAKADATTGGGFRDDSARARFDSEGIRAVLKDVQKLYQGEDKVYITGFSASTHVAYLFLFTHPELLNGAVINSGVYLGRGWTRTISLS